MTTMLDQDDKTFLHVRPSRYTDTHKVSFQLIEYEHRPRTSLDRFRFKVEQAVSTTGKTEKEMRPETKRAAAFQIFGLIDGLLRTLIGCRMKMSGAPDKFQKYDLRKAERRDL